MKLAAKKPNVLRRSAPAPKRLTHASGSYRGRAAPSSRRGSPEEEERIAQERLAEQAKRAEEERQAEEARRQEAARLAEEARKAEEAKKAEEERLAAEAEAKRIAEELKREEAERQAQEAAQKAAAERQAREAEQAKRRIAQQARERELARLAAKIDPNAQRSGTTRGDQRNFRRSLTGSALATWSNRVRACIRPNILFDVPVNTPRGRMSRNIKCACSPTANKSARPNSKRALGSPLTIPMSCVPFAYVIRSRSPLAAKLFQAC